MRQIINGKLYSTDSATLKVYWDNAGYESHEMADAYFHEIGVKDDFVAQSLYRRGHFRKRKIKHVKPIDVTA